MSENSENRKIPLLVIVGPTASGKSSVAVKAAELLNGEIISGDSMQIYRGMDIGTAKATPAERGGIPHRMIDIADIDEAFCVADFVEGAKNAAKEIYENKKLPIIAGGTGMYIKLLLSGGPPEDAPSDESLRKRLYAFAAEKGNEALWERLKEVDPESAEKTHYNNVKRVVRALEIYELTGETKSAKDAKKQPEIFNSFTAYLDLPREKMYERIDKRFDSMTESGLLGEIEELMKKGLEHAPTASGAIGYKEFFPYFHGLMSLKECIDRAKQSSRNYAKRQVTFFSGVKKDLTVPVENMSAKEAADYIVSRLPRGFCEF